MKIYSIIFLISAFIFTSCSSTQPVNTATNTATNSTANSTAAANSTASKPLVPIESLPPEHKPSTASPTETMKALNEAARAKNVAAIKLIVSKNTLAEMEKNARANGMTVDEIFSDDENTQFTEVPEMRNEKITGDRATVELKNTVTGAWSTLPFVKEDGVWKVAMDEYIKEVEKQMTEQMNEPPIKSANANKAK